MTRSCVLALLTLFACEQVLCAADLDAQVSAVLSTPGDIWQGQRVTVSVTIKTPDIFASEPAFDLPQVAGAILIPPQGHPVLGTEMIGDDTFTTQTHELAVIAQRAGTTTIPPFSIRFDSNAGFGKPTQTRTVTTAAVSFPVKRPPGTDDLAMILTTTRLNVTETWKPQPGEKDVAIGAAFTRTIQIDADNLPGLILPSFRASLPEGLHGYQREPILNDEDNRGDLIGHRTEVTTIVCERPGTYNLPSLKVSWWNPKQQRLQQATLPAHTITVTAPPKSETADAANVAPHDDRIRSSIRQWLFPLAALSTCIGAALWFRPAITQRYRTYQIARAQSEPYAFRTVIQACHSSDAHAAYQAIMNWRGKLDSATNPPSPFARNTDLSTQWLRLEASLYGPPDKLNSTMWSPHQLLNALIHYRNNWKQTRRSFFQYRPLPPLNP